MAIIQYRDHTEAPALDAQLASLAQQTMSTKGMLTMLGDYWTDYYRDTPTLAQAHSGFIAAAGRQVTKLLETVLSGNILDFPVEQGLSFDLLVFNKADFTTIYAEDGSIDSYFVPITDTNIVNVEFLTVSLFESPVILEKGTHFFIVKNEGIRFYVDIFSDPSITTYEYQISDTAAQSVLLWGTSIALSSYYIYQRYGRFLYRKAIDSYQYKWTVTSLMRYYTGAKTPSNIRDILDILFGIPYARYDDEVITDITWCNEDLTDWTEHERHDEAPYVRITTNRNVYYSYGLSTPKYAVGDTVPKNELFCSFCDVLDYINSPEWWKTSAMGFPDYIFPDEEDAENLTEDKKFDLMDRILKYNTVYTQVNITWESYDLYKLILSDLYTIIRTGFPVYLNPYVEVIFRILFMDDTEFIDVTKDELFIKLALIFSDPFCPFFQYDGQHYYSGRHIHQLWLHPDGRLTDILKLNITIPDWKDWFRFNKIYDGRFLYNGEVNHAPLDIVAWDRLFLNVGMQWQSQFLLPERVQDSDWYSHIKFEPWYDPFAPFNLYDGQTRYDGKYKHTFWRHDDGRMTDHLLLHLRMDSLWDRVVYPKFYDGRFEHNGLIDYSRPEMFAVDGGLALTVMPLLESRYREVLDRMSVLRMQMTAQDTVTFDESLTSDVRMDTSDAVEKKTDDVFHDLAVTAHLTTPFPEVTETDFSGHILFEKPFEDPFCPFNLYDGLSNYDGTYRHTLWRHDGGRLTDKLYMDLTLHNFSDQVRFQKFYDSRFRHNGFISYGNVPTIAMDDLMPVVQPEFKTRFTEVLDTMWEAVKLTVQDRYENESTKLHSHLQLGLQTDTMPEASDALAPVVQELFSDPFCPFFLYDGGAQYDGSQEHRLWLHRDGRLTDKTSIIQAVSRFTEAKFNVRDKLWEDIKLAFSDILEVSDRLETQLLVHAEDIMPAAHDSFATISQNTIFSDVLASGDEFVGHMQVFGVKDTIADTSVYLTYGGVAQYAGDCEHYTDPDSMACDGLVLKITRKSKRTGRRRTIFL